MLQNLLQSGKVLLYRLQDIQHEGLIGEPQHEQDSTEQH
jgi:hypothetical protein